MKKWVKPKESNEELIRMARDGDAESEEKLLSYNWRLCHHIAGKFHNTGIDPDDLASFASIGLMKAFNTFNLDKEIKFATYATRCMENEILMHLRKESKRKADMSLDTSLSIDIDGNQLTLGDILEHPLDAIGDFIDNEESRKLIEETYKELAKLPPRNRDVFIKSIIEDKTQKEVAEELGISQSYVSRITKKISGLLKNKVTKNIKEQEKGREEMATKVDLTTFAYVSKNYKFTIKELSELFSISEATCYSYKKKVDDIKDFSELDKFAIGNMVHDFRLSLQAKESEKPKVEKKPDPVRVPLEKPISLNPEVRKQDKPKYVLGPITGATLTEPNGEKIELIVKTDDVFGPPVTNYNNPRVEEELESLYKDTTKEVPAAQSESMVDLFAIKLNNASAEELTKTLATISALATPDSRYSLELSIKQSK